MTTIAATAARKNFFDIIKGAVEGHRNYRISHRKGVAVLMSESDYESMVETLELLSIPGFRNSIRQADKEVKAGQTLSMEEVFGK